MKDEMSAAKFHYITSSSAIAEGLRDALTALKSVESC